MSRTDDRLDVLLARHHNEEVHTRHVTALALAIFDALASRLDWTPMDRRLLEAAGRLHDIGFASSPTGHVHRAAVILKRSGIPGLSAVGVREAVAVMVLHGKGWQQILKSALFKGVRNPDRLMQLGAVLRIADALDHGHVQNTQIRRSKLRRQSLVLDLTTRAAPLNSTRAETKGDLWQAVMPLSLVMRETGVDDAGMYMPPLAPELPGAEVARRLMWRQFRIIQQHAVLLRTDDDPIHLHDIRVGMRRFRATARLFRIELTPTSAQALSERVRTLTTLLGPDRDADVWSGRLQTPPYQAALSRTLAGQRYLAREKARVRRALVHTRRVLASAACTEVLLDLSVLCRVELPEILREGESRPGVARMRRKLGRLCQVILQDQPLPTSTQVEAFHDVRRRCRLARYWAEYTAPLTSDTVSVLAMRLKQVSDALGRLHDLDTALTQSARATPDAVMRLLRRERRTALAEAHAAWTKLQRRKFRKTVAAELA